MSISPMLEKVDARFDANCGIPSPTIYTAKENEIDGRKAVLTGFDLAVRDPNR